MYNETQKLAFIDTISHASGRNSCVTIFRNSEKFEILYEKDIAYFSKIQMIEFLNSQKFNSITTSREYFTYLSRYTSWVDNSLRFSVSKDDLDYVGSIRDTLFKDVSDLIWEISLAIDPNQDQYPIISLYLAWLGLEIRDVIDLQNSSVDLDKGNIYSADGNILVSNIDAEILKILRKYKSTLIETRTQKQTFTVTQQTTNKFLHKMVSKNSNRSEVKRTTLHTAITSVKDRASLKLHKESRISYQNILRSGRLYRLYQAELAGLEISPRNKEKINEILCSKGDIFDNLFQYRKYKEAFDLK